MTKLKTCLLAATALGIALPAVAQIPTAATPPANEVAANAAVAEGDIVVTARKRSENLQDVPVAITAFDAADIKSARIERLDDLAKLTPGLNYTPLFGAQNQLPIIRGAAQTLGQLNVGVFLDGIYLSGKAGVDLELNDLERIEVVKGPQSALYGRNTFAGAINYITKRPSDTLTGHVEGTYGTHDLKKIVASVSGPLGGKARVRVGGFYRDFNGWYRSSIDGGRVDFEKNYGGTATLELTPVEALTATLRVTYSKEDNGQPPSNVIRNNDAPGTPAGGSVSQRRNLLFLGKVPTIARNGVTVNTQDVPGLPGGSYGDREETVRASGTLEYDFGGVALTSLTSYSKRNAEYTFDGDNTFCDRVAGCPNFGFPFAPAIPAGKSDFALSSSDGYFRDWSEELRLASTGKQRFDWLVGFYFFDNRTNSIDRGITLPGTLAITSYAAAAASYRYPRIILGTQSYSGFASGTFHISDRLGVTGEVRYEHEKQTFDQFPSAPAGTTGSATVFALRQSFHFWTPRVILNFQASDNLLTYASYARGAKTGGFNTGLNVFDNQRSYQPEYSNNYEVGFKSDLLDRRLRFNLAAYYDDWKDQQATCQNPISAGGSSTNRSYLCNVAASHIYGIESEIVVRPAKGFTVSGSYTYTHARYIRFVDDSLAQTRALAGLPALDFNGKFLPYVPEHKFVVSPRLEIPVSNTVRLEARADLQYQSRTYLRADNLQNFGDKTVLDLRLTGYAGGVRVQVFANNVFDNDYPVAGVRFFDSVNYSVSSPLVQGPPRREFGVSAGYSF